MPNVEFRPDPVAKRSDPIAKQEGDESYVLRHPASDQGKTKSRSLIAPVLITPVTIALAVPLGWAMWNA